MKSIKMTNIDIPEYRPLSALSKVFGIGFNYGFPWCVRNMAQTMAKNTIMIRIIYFRSQIFSAKPEDFIGHQADHPW